MKKGETRAAYEQRIRDREWSKVVCRLESEERLLVVKLANIRREIAKRQQSNQT